jgi:hypothetical protein
MPELQVHTCDTPDIIFKPPDPPKTNLTSSFSSRTIIGAIDDIGRLPGLI